MAETILKTIFQVKRGKAETWKEKNPILRVGEPGFAYDANIFKVGDGVTPWNDLKCITDAGNLTIRLRRDNDYNYDKIADTFIPANGEPCLVDTAKNGLCVKVGDGKTPYGQLEYVNKIFKKVYFKDSKAYADEAFENEVAGNGNLIYIDANNINDLYYFDDIANVFVSVGQKTIPASAEQAGIVKLYDTIGENVDGTMTQKAITENLSKKISATVIEDSETIVFSFT